MGGYPGGGYGDDMGGRMGGMYGDDEHDMQMRMMMQRQQQMQAMECDIRKILHHMHTLCSLSCTELPVHK